MKLNTIGFGEICIFALATSAISLTISKARIFESFRSFVTRKSSWFGKLVSCTYCTSHWVSAALVAYYNPSLPVSLQKSVAVDFCVLVFGIVAVSAIVSAVIMKLNASMVTSTQSEYTVEDVYKLRDALKKARDIISEQAEEIRQLRSK